jgi:hypothetical protein
MSGRQVRQHRQHFNLSESSKQMLEQLTALRYPGRQRRQSQLVEDLITEAFAREHPLPADEMGGPPSMGNQTRSWETQEGAVFPARVGREGGISSSEEMQPYEARTGQGRTTNGMVAEGRSHYETRRILRPRVCISCQREVHSEWKHCVYCGASLAPRCSACGAPRPPLEDVRFCFECGSPLE